MFLRMYRLAIAKYRTHYQIIFRVIYGYFYVNVMELVISPQNTMEHEEFLTQELLTYALFNYAK